MSTLENTPVFLIGAERSGTTLLRIMLDHHPRLAFRNEFEFAVDLVTDEGEYPDLDLYREHLSLSRTFGMSGFTIDESLAYPELVNSFLEQKRTGDGKEFVGATVHRHFLRLLHIWPEARFICIVRDGRDVALSRMKMGWGGNAWAAAFKWVEVEREIEALTSLVGPERVVRLTFEELVSDPVPVLGRLCDFLGLEYNDAMLDYENDSTYSRPSSSAIGRWRSHPKPRDIRLIESVQGEMLRERGYEMSGLPPIRPGTLTRARLRLGARVGRARFNAGRLGLGLWVRSIISKRAGTKGWRRRVRLQINEVQRRHLK